MKLIIQSLSACILSWISLNVKVRIRLFVWLRFPASASASTSPYRLMQNHQINSHYPNCSTSLRCMSNFPWTICFLYAFLQHAARNTLVFLATSPTKSISGLEWIHEARLSHTHLQSRRKLRMLSYDQSKDASAFSSVLTDRSTSEWMPKLQIYRHLSIHFSQFLEDFLHARWWMNGRRAASGNWSMQQNATLYRSMQEDGHSQAHTPSARHIPPVLWHG